MHLYWQNKRAVEMALFIHKIDRRPSLGRSPLSKGQMVHSVDAHGLIIISFNTILEYTTVLTIIDI